MNLPNVIAALVKAQHHSDSTAYAQCFADTAIVYDEGRTHKGLSEIKAWNEQTNATYAVSLTPVNYTPTPEGGILTTRVSGTFPGSPIVLNYNFELENGKILSLRIA